MTKISITIDDKRFKITDDDQEASALLRLADRDPRSFDLFLVSPSGVEEQVDDDQIVNLRDDMQFHARRKIHFTIDGEEHSTYDDDQTAAALIRLAGLDPSGYDLALVTGATRPKTFRDDQTVQIKDDDEFVTAKHAGSVA